MIFYFLPFLPAPNAYQAHNKRDNNFQEKAQHKLFMICLVLLGRINTI